MHRFSNKDMPATAPSDTTRSALTPVSKRAYRDIFVSNFNYGFGAPCSDTCPVCDSCDTEAHKQKAALAFLQQKIDRELAATNENITYDLQKTLPLPKLSTVISFYL